MLCQEHITDSKQAVKRKHKELKFTEMLSNKENLRKKYCSRKFIRNSNGARDILYE